MQERFAKHTQLAHFIYAVERCVSRNATNDSARDVRAADLQEETVKPIGMCRACGRGGSPDPTNTAAPKRTSQRAIDRAPMRERNPKKWVKLRSSMS